MSEDTKKMKFNFRRFICTAIVLLNLWSWSTQWLAIGIADSVEEVQWLLVFWAPLSGFFVVHFTIEYIKELRNMEETEDSSTQTQPS